MEEQEILYFYNQYGTIVDKDNKEVPMSEEDEAYRKYAEYLESKRTVGFTEFITEKDKEQLKKQIVTEYSQKVSEIAGLDDAILNKLTKDAEIPIEILEAQANLYNERDEILRDIEAGKIPDIMPKPEEEGEKPKEEQSKSEQ